VGRAIAQSPQKKPKDYGINTAPAAQRPSFIPFPFGFFTRPTNAEAFFFFLFSFKNNWFSS
jgi:hypothetical protein